MSGGAMDLDCMAPGCLDRETLRRLSRRSDTRGLAQLLIHLGLLSATGFLVWASRGHWWLIAALLLHGIALSFLFCALHECIHGTAFASRWANESVAWVCGALLMLPAQYFRLFHFAHHRYTQDPARDPELAVAPPATVAAYLWRVSGIPYWLDRVTVTLRHALSGQATEAFVPPEKSRLIVREARLLWACYLAVLAASLYLRRTDALIYWLIPALLGQPFLRLFLLAEHTGCPFNDDMLANTRTTRSNTLVRLIAWRMPYHAEHHCFPAVPFHALSEVSAHIGGSVRVRAPGYVAFHRELLRRLRGTGSAPAVRPRA
jgi:fatty acid desaturase